MVLSRSGYKEGYVIIHSLTQFYREEAVFLVPIKEGVLVVSGSVHEDDNFL